MVFRSLLLSFKYDKAGVSKHVFAVAANAYVRYKQIENCYPQLSSQRGPKLNMAALILGLLSAFGVSIVANFQVNILI